MSKQIITITIEIDDDEITALMTSPEGVSTKLRNCKYEISRPPVEAAPTTQGHRQYAPGSVINIELQGEVSDPDM